MYAYHHYFDAKKVSLLYPGKSAYVLGNFIKIGSQKELSDFECGLLFTEAQDNVKEWQKGIVEKVIEWATNNKKSDKK